MSETKAKGLPSAYDKTKNKNNLELKEEVFNYRCWNTNQIGNDQLDDQKLDWPITLIIFEKEPIGISPNQNDGGYGRP